MVVPTHAVDSHWLVPGRTRDRFGTVTFGFPMNSPRNFRNPSAVSAEISHGGAGGATPKKKSRLRMASGSPCVRVRPGGLVGR